MLAPQPFLIPRGTPISVYLRLQMLSRLGHQVDLVTYHLGEDVSIPGVTIYRIPNIPFIRQVQIGPSWAKPVLDLMLCGAAVGRLLRKSYQVIHSHEEAAFFAMVLAALFRKRHVYDMHSSLPRQLENFRFGAWGPLIWLFELLERAVLTTCDAIITVAPDLEELVRTIKPGARQACLENLPVHTVAGNALQATAAGLRTRLHLDGRFCIVYTGTFEPYQGLQLLLESARCVVETVPQVCFVLAGGQPQQVQHWQAKVDAGGLTEWFRFVGTVPLAESLAYLELADILVSPRREGPTTPLKIYSYLHSGKPIVATRLKAHTQVLSDTTALLVDPAPEALGAGLLRLAREPELRQRLGAQARALALEKYSGAEQLARLDGLYRALETVGPSHAGQPSG
jgi:glycosyltransferase involved in cell wall biosynthesis